MIASLPLPKTKVYKPVTAAELQHVKNVIKTSNEDKQKHNKFREWFVTFKRAVAFGNTTKFKELIADTQSYEGYNYESLFEKDQAEGNSILMAACCNGRESFVKYLLENGWQKKINHANSIGQTPYHLAMINAVINEKDPSLLKILVQYGADVLTIDKHGMTPFEISQKSVNQETKAYALEVNTFQRKKSTVLKANYYTSPEKKPPPSLVLPPLYRLREKCHCFSSTTNI